MFHSVIMLMTKYGPSFSIMVVKLGGTDEGNALNEGFSYQEGSFVNLSQIEKTRKYPENGAPNV